jgi:hypothetical protein
MKKICVVVGLIYFILMFTVTPGFGDECRGDLDGNGVIDGTDLAEFAGDYGSTECPDKTIKYIICEGNLSSGRRWCDNVDGTVTDMATGLVWLKDASWGSQKPWRCEDWSGCANDFDDAHLQAGILKDGMAGVGLSDGSVEGDWRLPTKNELIRIVQGTEAVSSQTPYWFIGVQPSDYWSSTTTYAYDPGYAWSVNMVYSDENFYHKLIYFHVWPVRGGN